MPGQGVTSMFNFGQTFGAIKGVCAALNLSYFFVSLQMEKHFELLIFKRLSRTKSHRNVPVFIKPPTKKDVNKSELFNS